MSVMMQRWTVLAWLTFLALPGPHASAAERGRVPVPIAIIDLDYRDTSGEPTDQTEIHTARLRRFMDTLREDLTRNGQFKVVALECDPAPCSIDQSDAGALLGAARAAGATLMLYGGIHKVSTLIQTANVVVADVERDAVVVQRSLNFRGDDDRSWLRAEKFLATQLNEELMKSNRR